MYIVIYNKMYLALLPCRLNQIQLWSIKPPVYERLMQKRSEIHCNKAAKCITQQMDKITFMAPCALLWHAKHCLLMGENRRNSLWETLKTGSREIITRLRLTANENKRCVQRIARYSCFFISHGFLCARRARALLTSSVFQSKGIFVRRAEGQT